MRHARFDVATLAVERVNVVLKAAYLLIAELPEAQGAPAWEVVAYGFETGEIPRGRYLVDITTLDGRVLSGPAVLVRSIEGTHVLRGDGELDGFDPAELA